MKQKFKYIFVVLVYKNITVLKDFFRALHLDNAHVIVVNSFYDTASLNECKATALAYNADFIPIENRGYGYGNNIGIEYALQSFTFDYLILSNSDIEINDLAYIDEIDATIPQVIAPRTHLRNGKLQNPNIPWYSSWFIPSLHHAYKNNSRKLLFFSHIYSRGCRELFRLINLITAKDRYKIYSCHGSFIIFTRPALMKLLPLFNEKMFLYNEELILAEKCRMLNIPIFYCPKIDILHLEGASSTNNRDISFQYNKESFEVLYNWLKRNNLH